MDEETALGLYGQTRIRQFEKRAHDLFLQNLVKGTTHWGPARSGRGGGGRGDAADDYTFVTYGQHVLAGHPIPSWPSCWAARRPDAGKGGSMHLLDVSNGVLGSYAIVAPAVIANGPRGRRSTGHRPGHRLLLRDGATHRRFHEALNLAACGVPVVFICENNQYMDTRDETVTAVKQRRPTARRYGSVQIVTATTSRRSTPWPATRSRRRAGARPSLIEALTTVTAPLAGRSGNTGPPRRWASGWHATRSPPTGRSWLPRVGEAAWTRSTPRPRQRG